MARTLQQEINDTIVLLEGSPMNEAGARKQVEALVAAAKAEGYQKAYAEYGPKAESLEDLLDEYETVTADAVKAGDLVSFKVYGNTPVTDGIVRGTVAGIAPFKQGVTLRIRRADNNFRYYEMPYSRSVRRYS